MSAPKIIFTPFQHADGQWQPHDEEMAEPESVEIDGSWVHVVTYRGPMGERERLRSYPIHVIDAIIWRAAGEDT
jgi:hypothetical protein